MAGTNTYTKEPYQTDSVGYPVNNDVERHTWAIVADASDGSVPDSPSAAAIYGWISRVDTIPGSPAPTVYGITLMDANGVDILGGNGSGRSATAPGYILFNPPIRVDSVLTLGVTGNTTNSAAITVRVVEENVR